MRGPDPWSEAGFGDGDHDPSSRKVGATIILVLVVLGLLGFSLFIFIAGLGTFLESMTDKGA